jgi:hypothetical protein
MEKNARICDVCETHVAGCKCEICNKDICEECTKELPVVFDEASAVLFNINACAKCNRQIMKVCLSEENIFQEVFKEKPELLKEIIEVIKNIMMLKKVSDDEPEKEAEIENPYSILPNNKYYPPIKRYPSPLKKYPYISEPKKYPKAPKNPYYISYENKLKEKKWWGLTTK